MLASGSIDSHGNLRLWQVATGKQLGSLEGHRGEVTAVAFSPDGTRLVSGGADNAALVWDVTRLRPAKAPASAPLTNEALNELWSQLAGEDAAKAYRAIGRFAEAPAQAVPFLSRRLAPARAADDRRMRGLLADLDSDRFAERQR